MPSIRLLPTRHNQPVCASFESEKAVLAFEREMRVHRAHVEAFTVTPMDRRADCGYQVSGSSGGVYTVDLVDASGRHDACTCPDFLGNGLGTCKHIEAVRRALASGVAARAVRGKLPAIAGVPTLTVAADGELGLRVCGPWNDRLLRTCGLTPTGKDSSVIARDGATIIAGHGQYGTRIVHAAVVAVERLRSTATRLARRDELVASLAAGSVGVDTLARPLFPYQKTGVAHLVAAGRALLADDMGLGKTVQAIAACEALRARGEARRIVVVTPASLKQQWAKEIERYAQRRAVVVGGGMQGRRQAFESDAPYKILNYELTWRELTRLRSLDADVLILDEAQRAKNFRTKTAATLRAIPSRFLFVLTGTPVENRLDDLYSLLQLIDPDVLGPLWRFNLEFHRQSHKGKVIGYKNLSALRERIAPVVLRRRKEEVLTQLPALTEQTRYVPLTKEQANLEADYRAVAAMYIALAEKRPLTEAEIKRLHMALLKARQACNAVELCDPASKIKASPKLDELEAVVGEIAAQGTSKMLIFSEWVEMLKLAAARLDKLGIGWAMLHGGVPSDRRPALLDRFAEDPEQRVLLSSDAGGVGLNLQVASYVIHLDLPWNPARLDQRTSRAHRLGQTRGVSVTYLCAETGIERGIEGTLAGKRAVRSAALDVASDVEELDAPSFSMFLRQLQDVLNIVAEPGKDVEVVEATEEPAEAVAAEVAPVAPAELPAAAPEAPAPATGLTEAETPTPSRQEPATAPVPAPPTARPTAPGRTGPARAGNRLQLARVVLDAGFSGDAVRAAYEALAAAVAGLLGDTPPATHAALVAAIYRDLIPSGRLASAAPAALARLRDLTSLEAEGVEVDAALARGAVAEAEEWVNRLALADRPA